MCAVHYTVPCIVLPGPWQFLAPAALVLRDSLLAVYCYCSIHAWCILQIGYVDMCLAFDAAGAAARSRMQGTRGQTRALLQT
jgi:hypothetical protein